MTVRLPVALLARSGDRVESGRSRKSKLIVPFSLPQDPLPDAFVGQIDVQGERYLPYPGVDSRLGQCPLQRTA